MKLARKKISLQIKLTFFCTVVLICIAAGLAAVSIWNVDRLFMKSDTIKTIASLDTKPMTEVPELQEQGAVQANEFSKAGATYSEAGATSVPLPEADMKTGKVRVEDMGGGGENNNLGQVIGNTSATITPVGEAAVADPGAVISIMVATQQHFNFATMWFMLGLILLGFLLIFFVTGRALKPVRQLSSTIQLMDENDLSQQIQEDYPSKEIGALAHSFNHLLSKLDSAFSAQRNFTAAAAHELKTPLACIRANLEVLLMDESPTPEEFRHSADITQRHTERLIQLVDELMDMNRPVQEEQIEPISVLELTEQVLEELQPRIQEKEVQITCEGEGIVEGERSMLYRLLYNLVENATKYNRQGGEIHIKAKQAEQKTILTVEDTGPGIPPEEAEEIFQPFYRLDKSRSRKTAGAGLGLSIVKSIAEKHGATVSAKPREGGGSIFTVTFYQKKQ